MSLGAVLVGISLALVTVSYVARPLRAGPSLSDEQRIEAWVVAADPRAAKHPGLCPKCGRRLGRGDRFCRGCGAALAKER